MAFANEDMLMAGLQWIKEEAGFITLNTVVSTTYQGAVSTTVAVSSISSDSFRGPVYLELLKAMNDSLEGSDCILYLNNILLTATYNSLVQAICILKATEPELLYSSSMGQMAVSTDQQVLLRDVYIKALQPTRGCSL